MWAIQKKKVSAEYITFIKDIYTDVMTNAITCDDESNV
jgi:hypothetical protein